MPLGATNLDYFSDPKSFYRVIRGPDAIQDILDSGKIRTKGSSTYKGAGKTEVPEGKVNLSGRPTDYPSFSKGGVNLDYALGDPDHYIIQTKDESIKASTRGRHGKGSTYFPTGENGEPLKELDAAKAQIFKHIGEGKYVPVSSKLKNIGKSIVSGGLGLGRMLAEAPAYEFLNPPSAGPSDPEDPVYKFETGQMTLDEFTKRIKGEVPSR